MSEEDIDELERLFRQLLTEDGRDAIPALVEFIAENHDDIIRTLRTEAYSR